MGRAAGGSHNLSTAQQMQTREGLPEVESMLFGGSDGRNKGEIARRSLFIKRPAGRQ
jgi:hypothetical protein